MKDLNLIKRKLEEYERRILRLKELERELNSLNTEGLESEANTIRSKLKDPRKVEEVEKAIVALKKIKESKAIVEKIKRIVSIPKSEDLIEKAESTLKIGNYDDAVRLAKEAEKIAKETDTKYRKARDRLNSAESAIEKAKEFGCDVSEAEKLLNNARLSLDRGNYEEAVSDASRSEEMAKEIKGEVKPEIEVNLSKKEFRVGVWERVSLKVLNRGNANAKDIKIEFKRAEVEGLGIIKSLAVGEERDLELDFMPKDAGSVPLKIDIRFNDVDGKRYEEQKTVRINVGEKKKEVAKEKEVEIPIEKKGIALTIERAIYDPCKRDFIEGALPRMKEWINRYDPSAYWFVISIQNNTDRAIEEWDIDLETSAALKIKESKIEGIEIEIPYEAHLNSFKISVPKEYGIVIPKGGAQRVYFKLRADKPKTMYEISGVFKSEVSDDVPIRAKEFKYLCDAGVSPEAVKVELKKTFSEKDAARLALSFKIVQEIDRMCNTGAKTEEYIDKLSVLRNYTEGFSDKFTTQVDEFARFMKQEQLEYLDEEYKVRVRRFCTNLVDVWISEFLKG